MDASSNGRLLPRLILVSGLPASGKTSLAAQIGEALRLPVITKDGIKEILFETLGWSDRPWSQKLGAASSELLWMIAEQHLHAGSSLVLESNFVQQFADPQIVKMRQEWDFKTIEVHCTADREVLLERYSRRAGSGDRHPGHMEWDAEQMETDLLPRIRRANDSTLNEADTLIEVNTNDFAMLDVDSVIAQVRGAL